MDERELLKLKKEIDEAKTEISELEGTKKQLMKSLKEKWECKTLKEAEVAHKELAEEISELSDKIKKATKELNEKYEL